jgi:hypothetical protein
MGPFPFWQNILHARGNALHRTNDLPHCNTLHCEVNDFAIAALLMASRRRRCDDRGC